MIDNAFWNGKRVFITGHTGFKGTWLSIWLNELGAIIHGYALAADTKPSLYNLANVNELISSTIGDIRDLSYLDKVISEFQPEIIFHLAAQSLVSVSYESPVETYSINVMGTVNLLESVRKCPSVKAIINVTTDKVYENKEWVWGYRENDQLGGYDPYSNSKACSEIITSSYINSFFNPELYQTHGVAIATARAGNVIGGGDWAKNRLIPDIVRAIEQSEEVFIRNPYAVRPWQHVLEPLSGYLMIAQKLYEKGCEWNGAWNLGPDNCQMTVKDVAESFLKSFDVKVPITYKSSQLHETNSLNLDCQKARHILKWSPLYDTNEVVVMTSQWYKDLLNGKSAYKSVIDQIKEIKM